MRRLAVLLLLLLAPACGGDKSPPAATNVETNASAPGLPAGFTARSVHDQGFSIAVPKDWRTLDAKQAFGSGAKEFERENPSLTGLVQALTRPNSPIKLIAVAPTSGGFATNLNVLISDVPADAPFGTWTREQAAQIDQLHPTQLRQGPAELNPGRGYSLAYHVTLTVKGSPKEVSIHQWMLKRGGSLYVLTYTTDTEHESEFADTFRQSAQTFRLTS